MRPMWTQRRGQHRPGRPGRDDRPGGTLAHQPARAHHRGVRASRARRPRARRTTRSRRRRRRSRSAAAGCPRRARPRAPRGRPHEQDAHALGGRLDGPGDDLGRGAIAAPCVDGDRRHASAAPRALPRGAARPRGRGSGRSSRHAWCGRTGLWHCGHTRQRRRRDARASRRRLSRRAFEVFFLGTAIGGGRIPARPLQQLRSFVPARIGLVLAAVVLAVRARGARRSAGTGRRSRAGTGSCPGSANTSASRAHALDVELVAVDDSRSASSSLAGRRRARGTRPASPSHVDGGVLQAAEARPAHVGLEPQLQVERRPRSPCSSSVARGADRARRRTPRRRSSSGVIAAGRARRRTSPGARPRVRADRPRHPPSPYWSGAPFVIGRRRARALVGLRRRAARGRARAPP